MKGREKRKEGEERKRKQGGKKVAPETMQYSDLGEGVCKGLALTLPAMDIEISMQNIGKWYLRDHSKVIFLLYDLLCFQ